MTAKDATRCCAELLESFGLRMTGPQGAVIGWQVHVVCYKALAAANRGATRGLKPGRKLEGLTLFRKREILLSETYCENDWQARQLISHEVAHALSGDCRCEDNPKFDSALAKTERRILIAKKAED